MFEARNIIIYEEANKRTLIKPINIINEVCSKQMTNGGKGSQHMIE